MLKEMSRRVVVMDVVGVVLGLAFTWLPSRSDGVADQRLAESLQILGINGEDILRGRKGDGSGFRFER